MVPFSAWYMLFWLGDWNLLISFTRISLPLCVQSVKDSKKTMAAFSQITDCNQAPTDCETDDEPSNLGGFGLLGVPTVSLIVKRSSEHSLNILLSIFYVGQHCL